ncbi:hypothetical protein GFS31_43750 (plasmid) [Leptolyngbya sp. BL0902]|nr:hypothetical protein GFS31_43750 [Leptolyngbya sp. BL0902]
MDWSQVIRHLLNCTEEFQSLRGFGVDWSYAASTLSRWASLVSIPERVWGGLELVHRCQESPVALRFNP